MSMNHHLLAKITTDSILENFKTGDWNYDGMGENFYRVGCDSVFPSPDATFYDDTKKLTISFEFKPPTETKRGILTGLGQSIAYLKKSNISYLIIPNQLNDFEMGEYMKELYQLQIKENIPVGLIIYDVNNPKDVSLTCNISPLEEIKEYTSMSNSRFWAKHQDLPLPLFHLILHCYYLKKVGIVAENKDAFAYCWDEFMAPKKAIEELKAVEIKDLNNETIRTLGGRKNIAFLEKKIAKVKTLSGQEKDDAILALKTDIDSNHIGDNTYNSYKKNYVTFLKHVGLIDSTGNLTEDGFNIYHIGLSSGPNSKLFKDYFLKLMLTVGHHLDLIFDLNKLCDKHKGDKSIAEIKEIMLQDYETRGMIKRNAARRAGDISRVGFLKYEFILWKAMDLIIKTEGKPEISFDWKRIVEICSLPESQ